MQETIRAAEWAEQATLPMICADGSVQLRKPRLYQGQDVGGYQLVAPMAVTAGSELWFARSRSGLRVRGSNDDFPIDRNSHAL